MNAVANPFTIIVDSAEQHPFSFTGIRADASRKRKGDSENPILAVETITQSLGHGMGDYSILGMVGRCNIERKSMNDAHGTFLGWGRRRERFEIELVNLAAMERGAVVVECSFGSLIANAPEFGEKTAAENAKILSRQVIAWQQDFSVPWFFCDSRRLAEIVTFRLLARFYRKNKPKRVLKATQTLLNNI